jgi:uroporphyrinogen-III synthase
LTLFARRQRLWKFLRAPEDTRVDKGLVGKRILVTRASVQAREFAAEIRKRGGKPVLFPTIDIAPPKSWANCDAAIAAINRYDVILFTSSNGVTHFFNRLRALGKTELPTNMKVIAVGERTAATLHELEILAVEMPARFSSAGVSALLKASRVRGTTFLFPCGNLRKEEILMHIRSLGGKVTPVTVYSTTKPRSSNVRRVQELLDRDKIDVLTFASPSAVFNFVSLIPSYPTRAQNPPSAAIGKTTASALREAGVRPAIIARISTSQGLLDEIAEYFSRRQQSARTRSIRNA